MNIRTFAHSLTKRFDSHRPLVEVHISKANLLANLHSYQTRYPELSFAPVLKSNAYGHGLVEVAKVLDNEDICFFMVDSYFEARTLRRAGIQSRIVIMGYVDPGEIVATALPYTEYAIVDLRQLQQVAKFATHPVRLHVKIDTGMHRHGIMPNQLDEAITLLSSNTNLEVAGVGSHFADADNTDPTNTLGQIGVWNEAVSRLEKEFPLLTYRHVAATKGVPMSSKANANVARLGIGLYGFDTSPSGDTHLAPVMEVTSVISSVREVPAGDFIGYNATYTAQTTMRIATVPYGYYEGLDRRLYNKGFVTIREVNCPIVGRISMNMSSVDVTEMPDAVPGDTVTLISRISANSNSVEKIAKLVSTSEYTETPYVILSQIPQHLKRVVQ